MSIMPQILDDRFQFVRKFPGVGGNNDAIFLATDIVTSKQVVLKRLYRGINGDRETEFHMRLANHPNIVQMVEYFAPSPIMMDPPVAIGPTDWKKDFYMNSKLHARLYLEACTVVVDNQELHTLREICRPHRMRKSLPELFIWSLYADLLKALCFMWFGVRDVMTEESPVAEWDPIVHRDIHTGNIFLAPPLPGDKISLTPSTESQTLKAINPAPEYPRVLLGDFGNSSSYHRYIHGMGNLWEPEADWDLWNLGLVMNELCWDKGYSQELLNIFEPLKNMQKKPKLDEGLLEYTRVVIKKMEELKEKGELVYAPL